MQSVSSRFWTRVAASIFFDDNHYTIHKSLHPTDDVDRLYGSRKEGGRGLTSIQDNIDASKQRLDDFMKKARKKTDYSYQKQ